MSKLTRSVLLRQFIHDRLYHPQEGYFCKSDIQVGELKQPINFKTLIGYSDYIEQLTKNYPPNAWLTPSEIFKPFYGMTIGNYINQAHQKLKSYGKSKQLRIVQVGAGTGAAADGILGYFKNFQPQLYEELKYTIVEISPVLSNICLNKLKQKHPQLVQSKRLRVINDDIVNYKDDRHSFIMFFQVLDNMPHDKVIYSPNVNKYNQQVLVDLDSKQETLRQITDSEVKQCLQAYTSLYPKLVSESLATRIGNKLFNRIPNNHSLFLPTHFYKVLSKLKSKNPSFDLIISDFDHLPSKIQGINAPIVSHKGKLSHQKIDYDTYLVDRGDADIFFPTDFSLVNSIFKKIFSRQGQVVKSHEFMKQFGLDNWATTKSGYNPIKQDFANTSFFVSKI